MQPGIVHPGQVYDTPLKGCKITWGFSWGESSILKRGLPLDGVKYGGIMGGKKVKIGIGLCFGGPR